MNVTTTMKMTLVLFILCSGFFHFTFASHNLRFFSVLSKTETRERTWKEILEACQEKNASFVTLYDEEDADFITKFISHKEIDKVWLGLHLGRNTIWSDGVPYAFNRSSVNLPEGEQICEAIDNGTWTGYNCSERKHFVCYNGFNYTLVETKRNWCQALEHCRKHFKDLASISDNTQNEEVIEEGKNTSFWIGLMHDKWKWADNSCSSFRKWEENNDPAPDNDCTSINQDSCNGRPLNKYGCGNVADAVCSKGKVRIKVIDKTRTWEEAFDYCRNHHTGLLWIDDEEDQKVVEQWLNHTDVDGPFWIGLRRSHVFGFWIWSDRTVAYTNWKDGEPSDLPMSHHCGVIDKTDYKWSSEKCLLQLPFLCEENIVSMDEGG